MKRVHRGNSKVWQERIEAAANFAGSAQQYCLREGIQASSFYKWRSRLSESRPIEASIPNFLPVVVDQNDSERAPELEKPSLPDPRWVAEFVSQLMRGAQ